MEPKFKVGDKVKAYGLSGSVIYIAEKAGLIEVCFYANGSTFTESFLRDGRKNKYHTVPLLEFVDRPRKKVKKKLYIAVKEMISDSTTREAHTTSYAYAERSHAENQFGAARQHIVEVEIEVLEEQ